MKQLFIALILLATTTCAYTQRDTVVNDSTPLLSVKHVEYLLHNVKERVKDKMTVKEYEELAQLFSQVVNQCAADYQRKKKPK
jgi:hypothetical protein